jgi:hypothetical protein
MSEPGARLETVLELLHRRVLREEVHSLQHRKARRLGFYNPVDHVKHLKSLSVFIHCARTVPVGR